MAHNPPPQGTGTGTAKRYEPWTGQTEPTIQPPQGYQTGVPPSVYVVAETDDMWKVNTADGSIRTQTGTGGSPLRSVSAGPNNAYTGEFDFATALARSDLSTVWTAGANGHNEPGGLQIDPNGDFLWYGERSGITGAGEFAAVMRYDASNGTILNDQDIVQGGNCREVVMAPADDEVYAAGGWGGGASIYKLDSALNEIWSNVLGTDTHTGMDSNRVDRVYTADFGSIIREFDDAGNVVNTDDLNPLVGDGVNQVAFQNNTIYVAASGRIFAYDGTIDSTNRSTITTNLAHGNHRQLVAGTSDDLYVISDNNLERVTISTGAIEWSIEPEPLVNLTGLDIDPP